jgi:hypothetical protein
MLQFIIYLFSFSLASCSTLIILLIFLILLLLRMLLIYFKMISFSFFYDRFTKINLLKFSIVVRHIFLVRVQIFVFAEYILLILIHLNWIFLFFQVLFIIIFNLSLNCFCIPFTPLFKPLRQGELVILIKQLHFMDFLWCTFR